MKKSLLFCLSLATLFAGCTPSSNAAETRCGWLKNPTPANWWLVDKDGSWTISAQGGFSAEGMESILDYLKENTSGQTAITGMLAPVLMSMLIATTKESLEFTRVNNCH